MSQLAFDPRLEGHEQVVTEAVRILRRRNEFVSWPAQATDAFARAVDEAATSAATRAAQSRPFLERGIAKYPELAEQLQALLGDLDFASRPVARNAPTEPLTMVVAKSTSSDHVFQCAELLELLARRSIDSASLDEARQRAGSAVDPWGPDEDEWHRAVGNSELAAALERLPAGFTPTKVRVARRPIPVRRPVPWGWLKVAGAGVTLGVVAFLAAFALLVLVLPFPSLDGSCDGGLCLFDPSFWVGTLGTLLVALVGAGLAAVVVVALVTTLGITRLTRATPKETQAARPQVREGDRSQ